MFKKMPVCRLMISCPSDVKTEIEIINRVVDNINDSIGFSMNIFVKTLYWSKNVMPEAGDYAIIFAFAPIENENRTLDQEEQKKFRKQALIILVLADMAIIISHKIHIEVCQWLLNGMIVAALLNLCGKIQTKCKLEKIW